MTSSPSRTALLEDPELRPFLPLLWIAWSDGDLEPADLRALEAHIAEMPWLRPAARIALSLWLEPNAPPSTKEMSTLLETLRKVAGTLDADQQRDLVELGMSLAPSGTIDADTRRALVQLEEAICGALGPSEVLTRSLAGLSIERPSAPPASTGAGERDESAPFDVRSMRAFLDGDQAAVRDEVRAFLDDPEKRAYGLPVPEYRSKVAGWLSELAERGFGKRAYPGVTSDEPDMGAFVATFEALAMGDLSLVVRYGVQFGLFGGSIFFLGTDEQRREMLPRIASLELPGCFAMSEVGHGSDVESLETEAVWDDNARSFILHTPHESSRKDWVGGAAQHARMATVFANLEVAGEKQGIHAFLVPIRDSQGALLDSVRAGDSGHKMGLNGVDNGRLWFDHVRVPENALLGRFARIDENGDYQSPIANSKKRFFTMLGTLVGGRISVASASVTAAKVGLAIAIRYASARRQFGPDAGREVTLISYPTHKRRLLPKLATTYVHSFAVDALRRRFAEVQRAGLTPSEGLQKDLVRAAGSTTSNDHRDQEPSEAPDSREVEAAAAALKALTSWHAVDTVEQCRQACGGQGYLSVNRLPELRADVDIFTTFEGDNTVLLQLVAKSLLAGFRKRFESNAVAGIVRQVMGKARTAVTEKNVVAARRTDREHLRDRAFHLAALRYREERLLETAAARLRKRIASKMDPHTAMLEVQEHMVALAKAHAERLALSWFDVATSQCADAELRTWLDKLGALHALTLLRQDASFYLGEGYFEANKESAMRKETDHLLQEIAPGARALVDAFGIPDACLAAPIAFMDPAHPRWP